MSLTEEKCFAIAITLVEQHDKERLLNAFLEILESTFPECQLKLYTVNNGLLVDPDDASHNKNLYRCIAARKTLYIKDESNFIYPVISLGKITQIILLKGESLSSQLKRLENLTTLFSNQQILLDSNNHDALTGLLNRHSFEERITGIVDSRHRRSEENNPACCFAIFDIDFFKKINDDFGHLYGDEVLILFANIMEETFRHDDILFRYGGEEFAIFLRDIELNTATVVLERFRKNIENHAFPQIGTVTVSIGLTQLNPKSSRAELISRADQALYFSKENGRNQVNSFEQLINTGHLIDSAPEADDIELF